MKINLLFWKRYEWNKNVKNRASKAVHIGILAKKYKIKFIACLGVLTFPLWYHRLNYNFAGNCLVNLYYFQTQCTNKIQSKWLSNGIIVDQLCKYTHSIALDDITDCWALRCRGLRFYGWFIWEKTVKKCSIS